MIKFEEHDSGFQVYYKNYLILNQTQKRLCLAIGVGRGNIKQALSLQNKR